MKARQKIQKVRNPKLAKIIGRKVKLRRNWEKIKNGVMKKLLRRKFETPLLRRRLLATGDAVLEEGNMWGDEYWGVDIRTGLGKNRLGILLMAVRDEIRGDDK